MMMARYPAQYPTTRIHISSNTPPGSQKPHDKTLQWLIKYLKLNYVIWLLFKGASGYQLQPTTAFMGKNKNAEVTGLNPHFLW